MRIDAAPQVLVVATVATALAVAPVVPAGPLGSAAEDGWDGVRDLAAEVGLVDEPRDTTTADHPPGTSGALSDPPPPWEGDEPTPDDGPGEGALPNGSQEGDPDDPSENRSDGPGDAGDGSQAPGNGSDGRGTDGDRTDGPGNGSDAPGNASVGLGMHASGLRSLEGGSGSQPGPSEFAYGQVWVGQWNLRWGWSNVDRQLDWLARHNVTPVIQVFYWGNDISKDCIQDGCAGKDMEGWSRLVDELTTHLEDRLQGREAVVVLEPEFNKGNVATYEPLDAAMAEKAREVDRGYSNATVALGLGGWGTENWDTWDRAMDASDWMGLQLMRGSTRDSRSTYADGAESLASQAQTLHEMSGKPVIVNDVALATYGGQPYRDLQAQELSEILDRRDELAEAGVQGVVYRALQDDPGATTQEYYGEAETTWGLRYANGTAKPSYGVWVEGVEG